MNPNNAVISEQSKEKLSSSLISLMETYPFQDITITQITQEANLSRKTFYRLFHTKEDLIVYKLWNLFSEYIDAYKSSTHKDYWDTLPYLFKYLKNLFHWLSKKPLLLSHLNQKKKSR